MPTQKLRGPKAWSLEKKPTGKARVLTEEFYLKLQNVYSLVKINVTDNRGMLISHMN